MTTPARLMAREELLEEEEELRLDISELSEEVRHATLMPGGEMRNYFISRLSAARSRLEDVQEELLAMGWRERS